MKISQTVLTFATEPPLSGHGNSLRGFVASQFAECMLTHNHDRNGKAVYIYPRVQYRIIKGNGMVIGIEEGAAIVQDIAAMLKVINIKGTEHEIVEKTVHDKAVLFAPIEKSISYCFTRPWLALNESNHKEYMNLSRQKDKEELLCRILIGNILSVAKSLSCVVDTDLRIDAINLKRTETFLKGTPMLGFVGTFSVNFAIPDYWGIGKSVSRGFGMLNRVGSVPERK